MGQSKTLDVYKRTQPGKTGCRVLTILLAFGVLTNEKLMLVLFVLETESCIPQDGLEFTM